MSNLAAAITENTVALRELTAALRGAHATIVPPDIAGRAIGAAAIPTYHEQRAAAAEENLQAEEPAPGMTYDKDVKPFAIKLAAKDKQAFLDLLAERSVKKGSDIDPLHLPEFLARIKRALGE